MLTIWMLNTQQARDMLNVKFTSLKHYIRVSIYKGGEHCAASATMPLRLVPMPISTYAEVRLLPNFEAKVIYINSLRDKYID